MDKQSELAKSQDGSPKDSTSVVFLRLPKSEAERLRTRAEADARTLTGTVRLALDAYLSEEGGR